MTFTNEKIDRQLAHAGRMLKSDKKLRLLGHLIRARKALLENQKLEACRAIDDFNSVVAQEFNGKPPSRITGFSFGEPNYVRWLLPGPFGRNPLKGIRKELAKQAGWKPGQRPDVKAR